MEGNPFTDAELDRIRELVSLMDLPPERKRILSPENLRWIRRNLCFNNFGDDVEEVMALLSSKTLW